MIALQERGAMEIEYTKPIHHTHPTGNQGSLNQYKLAKLVISNV